MGEAEGIGVVIPEPKSTAGWLAGMKGGYSDNIGGDDFAGSIRCVAGNGAGGVVGRDEPSGGMMIDWSAEPKRTETSGVCTIGPSS